MIKDRNKGITQITYNHLNLPKEIIFANNDKIEYLYTATGEKVRKKVTEGSQNQTTEYLNGFQYLDGELSFFPTAEGYVKATQVNNNTVFSYIYNYTDLPIIIGMGNIRLRYTRSPLNPSSVRILEEDHYYPFGLKHKGYNNQSHLIVGEPTSFPPVKIVPVTPDTWDDYKYKYDGKEFQDELGLNFYDYGARNYDPALGRWMNVDPLAEKFIGLSPYNYVANNPILFLDPDGMDTVSSLDEMWNSTTSSSTWTNNGDGTFDGGENDNDEESDGCPPPCAQDKTYIAPKYLKEPLITKPLDLKADSNEEDEEDNSVLILWLANYSPKIGAGTIGFEVKNDLLEYARRGGSLSPATLRYLKYSKSLGTLAGVTASVYSGYRVYDQYQQGGFNMVFQQRDFLDFGVGVVGLGGGTLVALGVISNPLGWSIAAGVLIYQGITIYHDLNY